MRTPGRIATFAAAALAVAIFVTQVVVELRRGAFVLSLPGVRLPLLTALLLGILAWVGTYVGARMAGPRQRTPRLALVLTAAYVGVGIVISVPMIRTHAVKLDMPTANAPSHIHVIGPFLRWAGPILIVIIALVITRVLALICVATIDRDA
jgi:hypothetical protein